MRHRIFLPAIIGLFLFLPLHVHAAQLIPDIWPWDEERSEADPEAHNLIIIDQLCEKGILDENECDSAKKAIAKKDYATLRPAGSLLAAYTPYNQMKSDEVISYPGSPKNERNFAINKAAIGVQGGLLFDWLNVKLLGEARPDDKGKYLFGIEYAYLSGKWSSFRWEGNTFIPAFGGAVGAMKIPFSRQNLTSTGELQFIRRSMAVEEMPIHYDVGATVDQEYKLIVGPMRRQIARLELRAGAFNGAGDRIFAPDNNDDMMYAARARLDLLSPMRPGEGDTMPRYWPGYQAALMPDSDWPELSLGASVLQNNDLARIVKSYGLDAEFRWSGLSLQGEMISTKFEPDLGNAQVSDSYAEDYETFGWYVQGGAFVIPRHVELAARYEEYSLDLLTENMAKRRLATTTYALNFHAVTRHRLKLMMDYSRRAELEGMPKQDNDTFTIQAALNF